MRQLYSVIIICLCVFTMVQPAYTALRGGVYNGISIDYSVLDETELAQKADSYYTSAVNSGGEISEDVTNALNLYRMLSEKSPDNALYVVRLGRLYDSIGKDRYARGYYYRAVAINRMSPEPYFSLGEYYFKRNNYRKALVMYKKAEELGYGGADMQERVDIIKSKLGITGEK